MDDILITIGGSVKALGEGKFRAPLITFGSEVKHDLAGDFFDAKTDYWTEFPGSVPLLYDHGMDSTLKTRRLGEGKAQLEIEDGAVWMSGQLRLANEYESAIYAMIEAGKMGTSSGSATHLVEREPAGKAFRVSSWPIVEASLTPTPAEPQNYGKVVPLKTWQESAVSFKSLTHPEEVPEEKPVAVKPDAIKAAYLGADIEDTLTMACVQRLNDALMYVACYDVLMGYGPNADKSLADKLATLRGAFDEFRDLSLKVVEAILTTVGDEDAPTGARYLRSVYLPPAPIEGDLPAGEARVVGLLKEQEFKTFLQTMGTVVGEMDRRVSWVHEKRTSTKQGRALSAENLSTIESVHDGMRQHLDTLSEMIKKHKDSAGGKGDSGKQTLSKQYAEFAYIQSRGGTITF